MEVTPEPNRTFRRGGFWVLVTVLSVLIIGQTLLLASAWHLAWSLQRPARVQAGRIVWLSLVLLCIEALLLFWVVIRYLRDRLLRRRPRRPAPYVDIWAEAGQRIQVEPEPDDEKPDDEA
jgi:hypothetical protein